MIRHRTCTRGPRCSGCADGRVGGSGGCATQTDPATYVVIAVGVVVVGALASYLPARRRSPREGRKTKACCWPLSETSNE